MARAPVRGLIVGLVGVALALAGLAFTIVDRGTPPAGAYPGLSLEATLALTAAVQTAGVITLSVVAAVIVWRRPRSLLTWTLTATAAAVGLGWFTAAYAVHGLLAAPGSMPLAQAAAWTQKAWWNLAGLGAVAVILLFPEGRLMSPRWKLLLGAGVVVFVAHLVAALSDPRPLLVGLLGRHVVHIVVPAALSPSGATLSRALTPLNWAQEAIQLLVLVAVLLRLRRTLGDSRLQLIWFAYGGSLYLVASLVSFAGRIPLGGFSRSDVGVALNVWGEASAIFIALIVVPVAIAVAMLRYRLYDIDVVINRTVVYGGLALFVTGSYAIVVGGLGTLLGQRAGASPLLSIVTVAALALLLQPVRARLEKLAAVAVYGKRARPYDVLSDFADGIARAEPAAVLLPRMVELLRAGTGASSTEVWVTVDDRLQLAAASPSPAAPPPTVADISEINARLAGAVSLEAVRQGGEVLGALVVAKARGEELSQVERRLFHDLASHAAVVLGRFRLVQELRESRSRIVASQDEERHRIERNLHDGAQQRFVYALLALGMAQAKSNGDSVAKGLVAEATREVQAGLKELRTLARGLQPPLLSESGVVAAARALADSAPIATAVVAEVGDRRYAQNLEATAYFVVAESLTNAVKHSGANAVEVRISESGGRLRITVRDDGKGGADSRHGSGIIGLQDRVAAAGGRMTLNSPPRGGTLITVELPCA